MRKDELIQIHALLLEVRHSLGENEDVPVEMQPTYGALDVRPTSIHKSKQSHQEAISILGGSIERSLKQADAESSNPR